MTHVIDLRKSIKNLEKILLVLFLFALCFLIVRTVYPFKYVKIVKKYSTMYHVDSNIIYAIIKVESGFKEKALSQKGASGLMQIIKSTADWAGSELKIEDYSFEKINDPEINIQIGCWYISRLLAQYDGNLDLALAAYNAGSGNVSKWLRNNEYSRDGENLHDIPFLETKNYLEKVKRNIKLYKVIMKIIRAV